MAKPLPLTDADGEVRELTADDFKSAVAFSELPESLQEVLQGRGKQKAPTKISTTVRFDADVIATFRATGRGWQSRMNDVLKDWLKEHSRV
ncbi:BrnA antitoxin family protein [Methylomonas albis]|uniref:BrnA antitoxin family protein n=1 Tax=Methylomonas albis TaxID=1854563 RepID=A0ABR9D808_9GAMM|nr:BrnA antitoxin family protein [Methylomonas albis]MBD9358389.1 BrnA antitoxin family protein [Methylomonas albis]